MDSTDPSAAGGLCRTREVQGEKVDPGNSSPELKSPFDVEPWTCPSGFSQMCCTGMIDPDGRAVGCAYCKTTTSCFSYSSMSILRYKCDGTSLTSLFS